MQKQDFTIHEMCNIFSTEIKERRQIKMEVLKEFRENKNLTQSEFAKGIGISTSLYIKIELRN